MKNAKWLVVALLVCIASAAAGAPPDPSVPSPALQQIQSLLADKAARTPAQRRIDSNLIYASRLARGMTAAAGVATLRTGVEIAEDGQTVVDVTARVSDSLLASIEQAGGTILDSHPASNSVRVRAPIAALDVIAELPGVVFIAPKQRAVTARAIRRSADDRPAGERHAPGFPERAARVKERLSRAGALSASEGDKTHRADAARSAFGVSGAGIKIGVLSDGVDTLSALQVAGKLPAVTVLPGQAGSGSEGAAMLEIVHDLAPNAQLYFATAFGGIASFAQNIRDLRAAGCDIIVDDVFYTEETPIQAGQAPAVLSTSNGGILIQAVNDVAASGALYFSSAGNSGNLDDGTASVWEGDFADGGSAGPIYGEPGRLHDFGGGNTRNVMYYEPYTVDLFWADPLGGSSNDYDLFVLDYNGLNVVASSTNFQTGTQDPFEEIAGADSLYYAFYAVVVKFSGQPRFLHLNASLGSLGIATSGQITGHAASPAANAYGVAATPAVDPGPYPNPFNSTNLVEEFSSDGPRRYFFQADGTPYTPGNFTATGGTLVPQPRLTAADGVSTKTFYTFYGTSAAAPHAAAIAALVRSGNPSLTPAQVGSALTSTAIDIEAPGPDRDSGAGILDAYAAVQAAGAAPKSFLTIESVSAAEDGANGNGALEPGECGSLAVRLANGSGSIGATAISATLSTSTPGVTIDVPSSGWPDLAAGASAAGVTPFQFQLAAGAACPLKIDFTLTVTFTGGSGPAVLTFSVRAGPASVTTTFDATPPPVFPGVVLVGTGQQTNRVYRSGVESSCAKPKFFPGTYPANLPRYDSYSFVNCGAAACVTVNLVANTPWLSSTAYQGSFNPASVGTNYLADSGSSGEVLSYSFNVAAGATFVVVVNEVAAGYGLGTEYTLWVDGACFGCANHAETNCCPAAALSPSTLPAGIPGSPYPDTVLTASGGVLPYTMSVSGLPTGMTAEINGASVTIGGTPAAPYSGNVNISGLDGIACPFSHDYLLFIGCPTPPTALIDAPASVCSLSVENVASAPDLGPGATYSWTIQGGTITSGAGTRTIHFSAGIGSSVTLQVTVTMVAGCPSTAKSATIPINPACGSFFTLQPCRVADTRNPVGTSGGPALAAGTTRTFPVGGLCGIPANAKAVVLNVAVTAPTNSGDLRVYPYGYAVPLASAINFRPGVTRANNAIVPLGVSGQVSILCEMPSGTTHAFLDVYGYFQ